MAQTDLRALHAQLTERQALHRGAVPQRAHADASFAPKAEYLFVADAEIADLDIDRRTMECTKPAFGLKLYATLATLGEAAIGRYLEQVVDRVADFADLLTATADFELACRPEANIVCFRHAPEGADDLDLVQERARARVVSSERFYLTRTTLAGRLATLHGAEPGDDPRRPASPARRPARLGLPTPRRARCRWLAASVLCSRRAKAVLGELSHSHRRARPSAHGRATARRLDGPDHASHH